MPITFTVNEHAARVVQITSKSTAQAFAAEICKKVDARRRHPDQTHLLASSLNTRSLPQIIPTKNGFVETCIAAYNQHHHLIIRPDDVWLTIITQFSFFANGHPEELKDRITPVHRRKPLSIAVNGDSWMSNSKWLSQAFVDSMKKNLRDKDLGSWLMPKFTTTTKADALCTSIIMMGTLQSHYACEDMTLCGIPTVTLEGSQADYIEIENRLNKLTEFGEETYVWGEMLRPIIRRFTRAFDGELHTTFWNQICHRTPEMCGEEHYTGWITAFCPFDQKGRWQLYIPSLPAHVGHLYVDEIQYHALRVDKVPWGFCQVDLKVINDDREWEATFVAGLMGQRVCNGPSGPQSMLKLEFNEPNTYIAPQPAWFIFEKRPYVPGPAHAPADLEDLEQYLRSPSALITGVPVVTVPSAFTPSPIDFSARSERSDGSQGGGYSHRSHPTSPTSSTESKEKGSPRKLRKDRPLDSSSKEPSSWIFTNFRRPLASSTNTHT